MADNMTIGPALAIGGNQVEMTPKGKIKVTNSQGKIKTLSQDEFKKQLIKNADKIEKGEDFEFKKDNKSLKAAGGVAALLSAAYVGLSIAVGKGTLTKSVAEAGKELGFMAKVKNVFVSIGQSGVDLWKALTGKAAKIKDKVKDKLTGKSKELQEKRYATYSKEQAANDAHRYYANNFEGVSQADRDSMISDSVRAFQDYDPVKFLKQKEIEKAKLTVEEFDIISAYAHAPEGVALTEEQMAILPSAFRDKESCQRFANMLEAKFAKIEEKFGKLNQ